MERSKVYKALDGERSYQDQKWGLQADEKTPIEYPYQQFLIDIEKHLEEAKAASYVNDVVEVQHQVRKITALGVKFGEVHGMPSRQPISFPDGNNFN